MFNDAVTYQKMIDASLKRHALLGVQDVLKKRNSSDGRQIRHKRQGWTQVIPADTGTRADYYGMLSHISRG